MSRMSCSDGFRDGRQVAVELLFCGMLLPGFVQYSSRHSWAIASSLFSVCLVSVHVVHPYSRMDTTAVRKILRFTLSNMSKTPKSACTTGQAEMVSTNWFLSWKWNNIKLNFRKGRENYGPTFYDILRYYYLLLRKFFTPACADSFSLEFEWQQVSASL